ncbi:hypothetical protein Tco_0803970 [Tanacetum coccineum]|uniref:Zinc finger, CCHC-type n=1 Tax=Tanacetum coccineum TaxID=301880 RepID=A0ABQ5A746_9ASTR
MSGDKNENTNIVYREVAASLSSYQCPVLNNTNYTLWALRIKKILLANGVCDLVEGISTSKEIDVKKDSSASAYLFQGLPEDLQMQVAGCETTKEIWDSLKSRFLGTEDEIIGKLKTYEERIKFRKGSQEDNSEKLLFRRQGNDRIMNATVEIIARRKDLKKVNYVILTVCALGTFVIVSGVDELKDGCLEAFANKEAELDELRRSRKMHLTFWNKPQLHLEKRMSIDERNHVSKLRLEGILDKVLGASVLKCHRQDEFVDTTSGNNRFHAYVVVVRDGFPPFINLITKADNKLSNPDLRKNGRSILAVPMIPLCSYFPKEAKSSESTSSSSTIKNVTLEPDKQIRTILTDDIFSVFLAICCTLQHPNETLTVILLLDIGLDPNTRGKKWRIQINHVDLLRAHIAFFFNMPIEKKSHQWIQ